MGQKINCFIIKDEDENIAVVGAYDKSSNNNLTLKHLSGTNLAEDANVIGTFDVEIPEPKITKVKMVK